MASITIPTKRVVLIKIKAVTRSLINTHRRSSLSRISYPQYRPRSSLSELLNVNHSPKRFSTGNSTFENASPTGNHRRDPASSLYTKDYKTSIARLTNPMELKASQVICLHWTLTSKSLSTGKLGDGPRRRVGTSYNSRRNPTTSMRNGIL